MKSKLLPHMLLVLPLAMMAGDRAALSQTTQADAKRFEANVDTSALALGEHHNYANKSAQFHRRLAEFVAGNMMFVVLHEMGHAVFSDMDIPILAREEDTADSFAATRLIKVGSGISDRVLAEAAQGFFTSSRRDKKEGDQVVYYDEHGLDPVRAYRIVCLTVGSDKEKFKQLADNTKLPADQQDLCVEDYRKTARAWDMVLKPHLRRPDQPKARIDVVYGEAKGDLEIHARSFRSIQLLELIAEHAADQFAWSAPFTIEMTTCGFINAQWVAKTRKLNLCYELAADFADLFDGYGTVDTP